MFIKAWAYACKSYEEESPISLMRELEPLFDRDLIKDPTGLKLKTYPSDTTLSTFVTCCAYVSVCIAKATDEAQNAEKFALAFIPEDFKKEDGVVVVAKRIWSKTKMLDKGAIEGIEAVFPMFIAMLREGVKGISVAGSNRFGVYETDFGWGRPAKVDITSVDRGLNIGWAESKDEKGGVEVGLALNKHVMHLFHGIFYEGLRID
ncbi:unnamed protein product [Sphenostylis stenocarpa]|uniref:Uncharacterized protein n=1 Tax=Sphenostylis stenocarpa TaxID=92480 RepID=A0AA86RN27_9FABA|nr:unnamed protein product [Sphenostylis stenocarpa]